MAGTDPRPDGPGRSQRGEAGLRSLHHHPRKCRHGSFRRDGRNRWKRPTRIIPIGEKLAATRSNQRRSTRRSASPCLGGDQVETLSLGLAEEITAALSPFRWITCVDGTLSAGNAGPAKPASPPWQRLDLDYLLDSTLQRS